MGDFAGGMLKYLRKHEVARVTIAGGFAKMTKGVASWGWSTVPQKHLNGRVIWYTQAKVIGGGSSINAQLYTRGNAKDYDAWASEAGAVGFVAPVSRVSSLRIRLVDFAITRGMKI